jgi:hypothetical protein
MKSRFLCASSHSCYIANKRDNSSVFMLQIIRSLTLRLENIEYRFVDTKLYADGL